MLEIFGALVIFFIGIPILISLLIAIPKWGWITLMMFIALTMIIVGNVLVHS